MARSVRADALSRRSRRRSVLFYAVALILVVGLAIGITLFLTRSSRQSGELFLADGRTPTTDTPPAESSCGSSRESFSPKTSDERTLVSYFTAINDKDYATAWNLLGDRLRSEYGSQQAFADMMSQHVSCVRALDIDPVGGQEYRVQFAAQYTTPFPAGSGQLPTFWTVSGGKIVSSGTGP